MTEVERASRRAILRLETKAESKDIMTLAGFTVLYTWELANGYWPDAPDYDDVRRPWWLFLTEIGLIQIGNRKRVLHIQWSTCLVRAIVTEDDVTKSQEYVHAHSTEKAVEYMKALRAAAERKEVVPS